jgi:hypothetical protein
MSQLQIAPLSVGKFIITEIKVDNILNALIVNKKLCL